MLTTASGLRFWMDVDGSTFSVAGPGGAWTGVRDSIRLLDSTGKGQSLNAGQLEVVSQSGSPEEGYDLLLGNADRRLRIALAGERPEVLIRVEYDSALLDGRGTEMVLSAICLSGRVEGSFDRVWKQGWQSWTPACVLPRTADDILEKPPVDGFEDHSRGFQSTDVLCLVGSGGALVAGYLGADRFLGQITLEGDTLSCCSKAGSLTLGNSGRLTSEPLALDFGPAAGALDRYAGAVAQHNNVALTGPPPTGWCSWYYYFTAVNEDAVIENLAFLAGHRRQLPVEYVQLDDGYQADIGDWLEWNEKFPHGPRWLVEEIHQAGLKAGLWLAPFIAGQNSKLARQHPDWLVRDDSGAPAIALVNWGQDNFALDLTRDDVQEWLSHLVKTVVDDWGFDYLKIDFIFAGAIPGRRANALFTPIEAYREGLAIIRRAVGERFVLACGALQLPSVGLVDGMRVGPDVAPWWKARGERLPGGGRRLLPAINGRPAAEAAIRNTLNRQWTHNKLWLNDADCVLVRETNTKLSDVEIQSLVTVIGLSGGLTVLSDNLSELSPQAIRRLSFILPPLPRPASVPTLFDSHLPDRLELLAGERLVVALFNWSDDTRDLTLALTSALAFDAWQEMPLGRHTGLLRLSDVPAHGCRLVVLSPDDGRPRVLGSSFHIGQGAHEVAAESYDEADQAFAVQLVPVPVADGSVWISWPFDTAYVEGSYRQLDLREGVLRLDLVVDQPVGLVVRPRPSAAEGSIE